MGTFWIIVKTTKEMEVFEMEILWLILLGALWGLLSDVERKYPEEVHRSRVERYLSRRK